MCPTSCFAMQFQIEEDNLRMKPPRIRKTRRPKKRKHCSLVGTERTIEKQMPVNQRRVKKTKTAAPENTTQFIMADKETIEPLIFPSPSGSTKSETSSLRSVRGTPLSERDLELAEEDLIQEFSELDFDYEYFQKDFDETYSRIQEETLYSLPKSELIERYQQLENREDNLHKQIRKLSGCTYLHPWDFIFNSRGSSCSTKTTSSSRDESESGNELEELRRKNKSLTEENSRLKALKCSSNTAVVRGLWESVWS